MLLVREGAPWRVTCGVPGPGEPGLILPHLLRELWLDRVRDRRDCRADAFWELPRRRAQLVRRRYYLGKKRLEGKIPDPIRCFLCYVDPANRRHPGPRPTPMQNFQN